MLYFCLSVAEEKGVTALPPQPIRSQRAPSVPVQLGIPPKAKPFPLFPQPLKIQRMVTPAARSPSCAYFAACFAPGAYPSPASASERVRFKASCLAMSHSPLTYVESTFIRQPVGIHSKALPQILNPLEATLIKNQGGGLALARRPHSPTSCESMSAAQTICMTYRVASASNLQSSEAAGNRVAVTQPDPTHDCPAE